MAITELVSEWNRVLIETPEPTLERKKTMIRRISIAILITACFMLAGLLLLAWRPSKTQIEPPSPSSVSAEQVVKGEALSAVGHYAACHTKLV